ncbi:ABC transporter [Pseudohyphozyma bogoriensis]|nr:ABC transporter [Pseudohyphozyma bogoriensis]
MTLQSAIDSLRGTSGVDKLLRKSPDDVVITLAHRSPLCKAGKGGFKDMGAQELLIAFFKAFIPKMGVDPAAIGDISVGYCLSPVAAYDARSAALAGGIPESVPVQVINRFCSSGLMAVSNVANQIRNDEIEIGLAIGFESMSANKDNGNSVWAPEVLALPAGKDATMPMGWTSENVAEDFNISRERMDYFAAISQQRAGAAQKSGHFDAEILPIEALRYPTAPASTTGPAPAREKVTVLKDDGIRGDSTPEGLGKIRAAFPQWGKSRTTGGNASQITDGVAGVLLMKRSKAEQLGLEILGKHVCTAVAGLPPRIMGIGPAYAIPKALARAGITREDVDLFEINEAFASMLAYLVDQDGLPHEKVNVNGGAIALGHPLGCTGARQVATGLHELKRRGGKVLVTSMCIDRGPSLPPATAPLSLLVVAFASLTSVSATSSSSTSPRLLESLSPFPNATFSSRPSRAVVLAREQQAALTSPVSAAPWSPGLLPPRQDCPPCNPFNCVLPAFTCQNTGVCNDYNGQCICPAGFGGEDCSKPLCGSLADGQDRYPREGDTCECEEGWGGLNCNVCETDAACTDLVLRDPVTGIKRGDEADDEDAPVCYKSGAVVREVYQMCDPPLLPTHCPLADRKILDMLPDRKPQVTFTCDVPSETCGFQFWIGRVESFYCSLSNCTTTFEMGYDSNYTESSCQSMECACVPGKMLCGEDGSVDISDFLTEEIAGPAKFSSRTGEGSKFEEPAMNSLINDIFGDSFITLQCSSGECLRASEVPGFVLPPKPDDQRWVVISIVIIAAVLLSGLFWSLLVFWYLGRSSTRLDYTFLGGRIRLGGSSTDDASNSLLEEHIPAALQFANLTYTLPNGRLVLSGVTGSVKPGEIMAIIGASGAGKSTLLDLLAKKEKRGSVGGAIMVNGKKVGDQEYRRVVGFVDQEDTLMPTLTVYETILYSALLRLPREMSYEDKKMRVLETMHELGILGIRDSRIGGEGIRGISGGEKRRVSIACELVTSPSILYLDEPTSGLDSFNAFNVVESLVQLSRTYKRTVVFTIHQPRSNIVALFDKLLLLASGKLIYSGNAKDCQSYFSSVGWACPPGFNIADYLIDLTMQDEKPEGHAEAEAALIQLEGEEDAVPVTDPELGVRRSRTSIVTDPSGGNDETELATRPNSAVEGPGSPFGRFFGNNSTPATPPALTPRIAALVEAYVGSDAKRKTEDEIRAATTSATANGHADGEPVVLRSYRRAGWWSQFVILSGRSFKNLYRNPMLMLSHYAVSVIVAVICALLFKDLTNDIPGFQNRMGLFFFCLALFGFGCLTTLNAFAAERHLFTRERANGYYSPITWFAAKLLFDIVPLRVIPPFVLGAIIYGPVGLVPTVGSFWRFILVLVLFNLTASSVVLFLSVLIKDPGVANLIGSLVMLFNLLFAGLLINREKLPSYLQWLETTSFFHAAFEGLLVNEVRYLQLIEHRYGVDIEVPAATILSIFGFKAQAFWFPDISLLLGLFAAFTAASFVALVVLVKERR